MTSAAPRFRELDGLRGLAVGLVVLGHTITVFLPALGPRPWIGAVLQSILNYASALCMPGVDIFFVLSGLLIGGIMLDHRRSPNFVPAFYARRFFRIVPIFLLLVASYVAATELEARFRLGLAANLESSAPLPIVRYLLFIQNNVMAATQSFLPLWMVVTWSVAVEEQFYLLAPWLARIAWRSALPTLCLALLVVGPVLRFRYAIAADNPVAATFLLACRADSLAAGVLLAWLLREERWAVWLSARPRVLGAAAAAVIAAYLLRVAVPLPDLPFLFPAHKEWLVQTHVIAHSLYAAGTALTILHLRFSPGSPLAGFFRLSPLTRLGTISYFVYLFHVPVFSVSVLFFRSAASIPAALAATLGLGALSWIWLERPLTQFGRVQFPYDSPRR